jgi:hypothetical protein
MQIHIQLIPVSSTDQPPPSPDPPQQIFHYTTGTRLKQIINSGVIRPTTAKIEPHEKPVAWFSTQDQWEPTATKVPIPGMAGQIATARAQGGLVRVLLDGARYAGTWSHDEKGGHLFGVIERGEAAGK